MRYLYVVVGAGLLFLAGCRGCTSQHDPRDDWKKFSEESSTANRPEQKLTDDGKIPAPAAQVAQEVGNPIDEKYANFCSSCHGPQGKGDGAAAGGLNPKPRNFVTWNEPKAVDDAYIAKVIREGGAAVGKSPLMAPWGGVLNEDDITAMVAKVKSFKN